MTSVPDLIRQARLQAGLTQHALASRAGTSQAAVARYEAGVVSPAVDTLSRLLHGTGHVLSIDAHPVPVASDLSGPKASKVRRHRGAIKQLVRGANATNPRIFGSVARGEDRPDSDIDVLVDFDIRDGLQPLIDLKQSLEQLLGDSVDVTTPAILRPRIAARVLADAVPL